MFRSFLRDEEGQDLIEYGLLAGLISIAAFAAMSLTGTSVNDLYVFIQTKVAAVAAAS